ncbi:uncharacterized protein [Panulirus ornatus]|uniref:uncharacterized protein isoform X1 n=1 Tax=Panulirus ornatus TaxID=150431 RepID=UPI003A8C4E8B
MLHSSVWGTFTTRLTRWWEENRAHAKKMKGEKCVWVPFFLALALSLWQTAIDNQVSAVDIEVTPTNTNGFELGELSGLQMIFLTLAFVKLLALTFLGILPVDVDLGAVAKHARYLMTWARADDHEDPYLQYLDVQDAAQGRSVQKMEETSFLLDCPLQFVCDVDDWANREDHQHYAERLLASWFRNPKHSWHQPGADVYTGIGTCKEMYPCPFDVQEVIGIRIPGSNDLTSSSSSSANSQEDSYVF